MVQLEPLHFPSLLTVWLKIIFHTALILIFFQKAFDLEIRFVHFSEMETFLSRLTFPYFIVFSQKEPLNFSNFLYHLWEYCFFWKIA